MQSRELSPWGSFFNSLKNLAWNLSLPLRMLRDAGLSLGRKVWNYIFPPTQNLNMPAPPPIRVFNPEVIINLPPPSTQAIEHEKKLLNQNMDRLPRTSAQALNLEVKSNLAPFSLPVSVTTYLNKDHILEPATHDKSLNQIFQSSNPHQTSVSASLEHRFLSRPTPKISKNPLMRLFLSDPLKLFLQSQENRLTGSPLLSIRDRSCTSYLSTCETKNPTNIHSNHLSDLKIDTDFQIFNSLTDMKKSFMFQGGNSMQIFIRAFDEKKREMRTVTLDVGPNEIIASVMKKFMDKFDIQDDSFLLRFWKRSPHNYFELHNTLIECNIQKEDTILQHPTRYGYTRTEVLTYLNKLKQGATAYMKGAACGAFSKLLPSDIAREVGSFLVEKSYTNLAITCKAAAMTAASNAREIFSKPRHKI